MPRIRPSVIIETSWAEKAMAAFGNPREASMTIIADVSSAAFGYYMGPLGKKVVTFVSFCTAVGATTGSLEGIRRAFLRIPLQDFGKDVSLSFPILYFGSQLPPQYQLLVSGGGICVAMRGFVGTASQVQQEEERGNNKGIIRKLAGRSLEWGAGAAAGTAAAGALSGVAGVALSIGAGVVAGKTARAAVRMLDTALFG